MQKPKITNRKKELSFFVFAFLFLILPCEAADVYLGLQAYGGNGQSLGVGLASFMPVNADARSQASTLRAVLREDLLFSRLFNVTEGGPTPTSDKVDSLAWSGLAAQVLVGGEVSTSGEDIHLVCKIYDVGTGKVLYAKEGDAKPASSRRLAHLMADQLIFQLSGQPGIAHSHIAFVSRRGHNKEIFTADYDGQNLRQMTFDQSIALLPKWSPDGKEIAFNSYRAQNPDAYILNYPGGNIRPLSMRQGLNTAPSWSPDGSMLALTISRGADPELYLINPSGKVLRRLTYSPGVDTSPSFSPNGQEIVFVSDRAGNPELYVMDISGANLQRLTYGQWVDAPAWSPKGNVIAYERQRPQGRYDIDLIDPSGRNNVALTEDSGRNENPSWSPDGRFILFTSTRDGRPRLYMMGADGSNQHPVGDIPGDAYTPSWGP